jgi:hypothetical protein
MKSGSQFEVVLRKQKRKCLPKKILRHTKIPVSDKYTFNASVWIADTPEGNYMPTVNLTLQHNGDKIRFCYPDAVSMCLSMNQLTHFLDEVFVLVHERHTQAVDEFLSFHDKNKLPPINDYTVYTVIQDNQAKGSENKASVVNTKTGEIVHEFIDDSVARESATTKS